MADRLSAVKALEMAAELLTLDRVDPDSARIAEAYCYYATAYTLVQQHVEVRTGGI